MKKLIILAVVAVAAAFCEAAPRSKAAPMPVDENGWRCEGDCDPDTPCEFCNPPKKSAAKSAAKKAAKKAAKTPRKRSAKKAAKSGESAAKTPRKRAAKPRKRSVKAVEESEG